MTNESDLVPLHMHNLLTAGPAPWTDTRVPSEVWHVARAVYGTSTEDDEKRVYRTLQAALWKLAAPQPEAQPPGFALVQIAELTKWKSLANSLAVLSLKSERATTAIILKSLIQDAIDAAPSAQAEPQKPNYRAECWPESPHNKQAEQGGKR